MNKAVGLAVLLALAALLFAAAGPLPDARNGAHAATRGAVSYYPGGDYWERPDCGGFGFPECGTDVDAPPVLDAVTLLVDGEAVTMPATVRTSSVLTLHLEFTYPNGAVLGGHVFIIKSDDQICLDGDGSPAPSGSAEVPSMWSEGPYDWSVSPALFLNGAGAPYYVEISNGCGTHSNRLPLDIVAKKEEADQDDEGCGCGG